MAASAEEGAGPRGPHPIARRRGMSTDLLPIATDFLNREALYLDERRWEDWLALYHPDAEFWVPAWKNESEYTVDPENEISLMYVASRTQLEERVSRGKSGRSAASVVMPRHAHAITNIMVRPAAKNGGVTSSPVATPPHS